MSIQQARRLQTTRQLAPVRMLRFHCKARARTTLPLLGPEGCFMSSFPVGSLLNWETGDTFKSKTWTKMMWFHINWKHLENNTLPKKNWSSSSVSSLHVLLVISDLYRGAEIYS